MKKRHILTLLPIFLFILSFFAIQSFAATVTIGGTTYDIDKLPACPTNSRWTSAEPCACTTSEACAQNEFCVLDEGNKRCKTAYTSTYGIKPKGSICKVDSDCKEGLYCKQYAAQKLCATKFKASAPSQPADQGSSGSSGSAAGSKGLGVECSASSECQTPFKCFTGIEVVLGSTIKPEDESHCHYTKCTKGKEVTSRCTCGLNTVICSSGTYCWFEGNPMNPANYKCLTKSQLDSKLNKQEQKQAEQQAAASGPSCKSTSPIQIPKEVSSGCSCKYKTAESWRYEKCGSGQYCGLYKGCADMPKKQESAAPTPQEQDTKSAHGKKESWKYKGWAKGPGGDSCTKYSDGSKTIYACNADCSVLGEKTLLVDESGNRLGFFGTDGSLHFHAPPGGWVGCPSNIKDEAAEPAEEDKGGEVGDSCVHYTQCQTGLTCIKDTCRPEAESECSRDIDCDDGNSCVYSKCVPPRKENEECTTSPDCVEGMTCVDNKCQKKTDDKDIPSCSKDVIVDLPECVCKGTLTSDNCVKDQYCGDDGFCTTPKPYVEDSDKESKDLMFDKILEGLPACTDDTIADSECACGSGEKKDRCLKDNYCKDGVCTTPIPTGPDAPELSDCGNDRKVDGECVCQLGEKKDLCVKDDYCKDGKCTTPLPAQPEADPGKDTEEFFDETLEEAEGLGAPKGLNDICFSSNDCNQIYRCEWVLDSRNYKSKRKICTYPKCTPGTEYLGPRCTCESANEICQKPQVCTKLAAPAPDGQAFACLSKEESTKTKQAEQGVAVDGRSKETTPEALKACTKHTCSVIMVSMKGPDIDKKKWVRQGTPETLKPGKENKYKINIIASKQETTAKCLIINKKKYVRSNKRFTIFREAGDDPWIFTIRGYADKECTQKIPTASARVVFKPGETDEEAAARTAKDMDAQFELLKEEYLFIEESAVDPEVNPEKRNDLLDRLELLKQELVYMKDALGGTTE